MFDNMVNAYQRYADSLYPLVPHMEHVVLHCGSAPPDPAQLDTAKSGQFTAAPLELLPSNSKSSDWSSSDDERSVIVMNMEVDSDIDDIVPNPDHLA